MTRLSRNEAVLRVLSVHSFNPQERKTAPTIYRTGVQFSDFTSAILTSEVPEMPEAGTVIRAQFAGQADSIEVAITSGNRTVFNRPDMTGYKNTRVLPAPLPPDIVIKRAVAEGWEDWLLDKFKARLVEGHL